MNRGVARAVKFSLLFNLTLNFDSSPMSNGVWVMSKNMNLKLISQRNNCKAWEKLYEKEAQSPQMFENINTKEDRVFGCGYLPCGNFQSYL